MMEFHSMVGKSVLHRASGVVGKVSAFHDGNTSQFVANIVPVVDPVIVLENGHSFLAKPGAFVVLEANAEKFFEVTQMGLSTLVRVAAVAASSDGVDPETAFALLVSALRAQTRALETPEVPA